jgi:hypothetical protein
MILRTCIVAIAGIMMFSTGQAQAATIKKTAKGYVIMIETPTGKHCWGMPQHLDLKYFPEKPMDVEAAARKYHWPKPSKDQKSACQAMKKIRWKVSSNQQQTMQPVYKIIDNKDKLHNKVTETVIDEINSNAVCGAYVNDYGISTDQTWRLVTGKSGKEGAALCKEYK